MKGALLNSLAAACMAANGSGPHGSGFTRYRYDAEEEQRQQSAADSKRARKNARRAAQAGDRGRR